MQIAEKSLQTILGAMPDGLLVVDDRRRVQLTSAKVIDLFGKAAGTPGRHAGEVDKSPLSAVLPKILGTSLWSLPPKRIIMVLAD